MTAGEPGKIGTITCPCCQNLCELRKDKNGKTFFTCHRCGLQPHSRGEESTRWMYKLSKNLGKKATAKPNDDLCPSCGEDVCWVRLAYKKYEITLESSFWKEDTTAVIEICVCPKCGFIVGSMKKK